MSDCYSVFCARKLVLNRGFFKEGPSKSDKGWKVVSAQEAIIASMGLTTFSYPCQIHSFKLPDERNQILKSYVKIGEHGIIQIFLNEASNHCWQRFYVCKEIIHIIASNKQNATLGCEKINSIIQALQLQEFIPTNPANTIEHEAKLGAIELLLPKELVDQENINHPDGYSENDLDDISKKYRVPRNLVALRFTNKEIINFYNSCYQNTKYKNAEFLSMYT